MKCPACLNDIEAACIENHVDPFGAGAFRILKCPKCTVVFSDPMKPADQEYQIKADPHRKLIYTKAVDWRYRSFLSEKIEHKGKILDIGCGSGNFLLAARDAGYETFGVDFDERMIDMGKTWGLANLAVGNFEEVYAKYTGTFNAVTLFDVLEHIAAPNMLIGKVREMLAPGGYLAITVPNGSKPLLLEREEFDYPPRHLTRWSADSLTGFLKLKGFDVLNVKLSFITVNNVYTSIYSFFVPRIVSAVKSIFFGNKATGGEKVPLDALISKEKGAPAAKLLLNTQARQNIIARASSVAYILLWPLCSLTALFFALRSIFDRNTGNTIYVLAQKRRGS